MSISNRQIELFNSLFKGREDVYAKRWEQKDRSGYMPAYDVDWDQYEKHKALGGTFQNFKHKTLAPLTSQVIENHLLGKETVGIYPLLKNNTSWFLAADFDKKNWPDESRRFIHKCREYKIPAYLERSRSGDGGHVWIFFHEPYPARKSRKMAYFFCGRLAYFLNLKKTPVSTGCSLTRILIRAKDLETCSHCHSRKTVWLMETAVLLILKKVSH